LTVLSMLAARMIANPRARKVHLLQEIGGTALDTVGQEVLVCIEGVRDRGMLLHSHQH
jgi:hypothetical protein